MTFGAGFLSQALDTAIRSLALALLAWIVLRTCRVKSAAAQHAVWTLVMVGMALLAFRPIVPPIRARVLPALRVQPVEYAPEVDRTDLLPDATQREPGVAPVKPSAPMRSVMIQRYWPQAPVVIYAAAAVFFLLQLATGYWLVLRLRRKGRKIRQTDGVPVYECPQVSVPMAVGFSGHAFCFPWRGARGPWKNWRPPWCTNARTSVARTGQSRYCRH